MLEADQPLELTNEEVHYLQSICKLDPYEESPLQTVRDITTDESTVEDLEKRELVADQSRPQREVLRRLLIVSQPCCRIVLLRAGTDESQRMLDVYERSGAFVRYERREVRSSAVGAERGTSGERRETVPCVLHRVGPPLELVDVFDEVVCHFAARHSSGDFINVKLDPAEHFAFSVFAAELVARKRRGLSGAKLRTLRSDSASGAWMNSTLDGAALLPGKRKLEGPNPLSIPTEKEWDGALESLAEKDLIEKTKDKYELRHFWHDLAIGVGGKDRYILTRFDFGPGDSFVRDLTLVTTPGSIFRVRSTRNGGLRVRELDGAGLDRAVRQTLEDVQVSDTVDT